MLWLGKRSLIRDRKRGSSSSINFETFMSLRTRITIVVSVNFGYSLLVEPSVFSTDRMFLRPKS